MKQEDANKTMPCDAVLKGYERISGGGQGVPIVCLRAKGHLGLHDDPCDGRPISWPQHGRIHEVIDVMWEGVPKPFRRKNEEVVQEAVRDLIVNLDDAAEYALILVENGRKEFQAIYDEIVKLRRIAKNL